MMMALLLLLLLLRHRHYRRRLRGPERLLLPRRQGCGWSRLRVSGVVAAAVSRSEGPSMAEGVLLLVVPGGSVFPCCRNRGGGSFDFGGGDAVEGGVGGGVRK